MEKNDVFVWNSKPVTVRVKNKLRGRVDIHRNMGSSELAWLASNPNLEVEILADDVIKKKMPRYKLILKYILLLIITLTHGLASASDYAVMNGQKFESCVSSAAIFEVDGEKFPVNYSHCSKGSITMGSISKQIVYASNNVFEFIKKLGLPISECRYNTNLEIYEVSSDFLNDPQNFRGWSIKNVNGIKIAGLYDPRDLEPGVSSIMLTDYGPEWNDIIFAHELSHYWYNRLCLTNHWKSGTEKFAMEFEDYIKTEEGK